MAQQREATTDRLVGIIASIKMERKSGQLRVRRGEGLTSEEGILTFLRGQVTRASVGRRSGADALNWLSTWGQAHYTFVPAVANDEVSIVLSTLPSSSLSGTVAYPDLPAARVNTDELEPGHLSDANEEIPWNCVDLSEATTRIEHAGLSRAHRRLYLLINGRRSARELAPLLGKKVEETRSMLRDLEWLDIIQFRSGGPEHTGAPAEKPYKPEAGRGQGD